MLNPIAKKLRTLLKNQRGAYFIMSTIVLFSLFGFAALGIEIGRWYVIQGEISKSIDGAAFAGAKNVSNPKFPDDAALAAFVQEVAAANFEEGLLGTDLPVFTVTQDGNGKVQVNGDVHSLNSMTTVFETGTTLTNLGAVGAAKLRKAEVALVLDVSGSMGGQPIVDLKTGAETFVENFQSFQKDHKFALLTFATGVQTPVPLDNDFVFDMTSEINGLNAVGGTNTEDALGQAGTLPWEPDQLLLPVNERTRQVVILFSDGNPSGFRAQFKNGGVDQDAVGLNTGGGSIYPLLGNPNVQGQYFGSGVDVSGDGKTSGSACSGSQTTKWYIMDDPVYGVNASGSPIAGGYSSPYCYLPAGVFQTYEAWLVRQMAIDHAAELKAMGITVYTIGLGNIDEAFLGTLATSSEHAFFTTDSGELEGIFQTIANELKLILVT